MLRNIRTMIVLNTIFVLKARLTYKERVFFKTKKLDVIE